MGFALHQVTGNICGEQVCTIDIDTPKLLDTVEWVCNDIEVLGEACIVDEMVDLGIISVDLCECLLTDLGSELLVDAYSR